MRGKLIVISGFSGAGKDSVARGLMELCDNYTYSISATTRKPRENEKEGVDYYFLSEAEFAEKALSGQFLEYATFCGNQYGTPAAPVAEKLDEGRDVILVIECIGAMNIKNLFPDAILVFVSTESMEVLEERIRKRGKDDEETIRKRLAKAKEEAWMIPKYDYLVVNKDRQLDKSVQLIHNIVKTEKSRTSCNMDFIESLISE